MQVRRHVAEDAICAGAAGRTRVKIPVSRGGAGRGTGVVRGGEMVMGSRSWKRREVDTVGLIRLV